MAGARFIRATLCVALTLSGACGGPKEADDPHQFIADDLEAQGFEDDAGGAAADRSGAAEPTAGAAPGDPPATRAECEAAARRTMELRGGERAKAGGLDEAATRATEDCLAWETPRSEARCVARARDAAAVQACVE